MKKLIAILSIAILGFTGAANAQKFGHLDSEKAFAAVPGYKAAEAEMQRYATQKEKEVQDAINSYKALLQDFQTKQATMSAERVSFERENLLAREQSVLKFQEVSSQRVSEKREELMKPLKKQLEDAIKKVAKDKGYAYILDKTLFLNIEGGNDVTDLVIVELKKNAAPVINKANTGVSPKPAGPIMQRK